MQYVQNLNGIGCKAIENQIVPIGAPTHTAALVAGNKRIGSRHAAKFAAAGLKLGHKGFGSAGIVSLDATADRNEIFDPVSVRMTIIGRCLVP